MEDQPSRMGSRVLRTYPWSTGILSHPNLSAIFDSQSQFKKFILRVIEVEHEIFTSFNQDAMGVRRLLSFGDQVDENRDKLKTHMHRLFEMFVSYRVLDLLTLVEGIPCLVAFPKQVKLPNLGPHIDKNGWHHIEDWKALVQKFQQSVRQIPETLPSGTRADQMVTLGRLLAKNTRAKILLNIHIASMHLADLLASSDHEKADFLDNLQDCFLEKSLSNVHCAGEAEVNEIKGLMGKYKPNQLRLPLHVAVMISPLYLLIPIQLYSVKWDRRAMFLTSKALGSQKPPLLVEVETRFMESLFRLACMKSNLDAEMRTFCSWVQEKAPDVISEVPDSRSFFKSNPSIPFAAKFASTNIQVPALASSPGDVDDRDGDDESSNAGDFDMGDPEADAEANMCMSEKSDEEATDDCQMDVDDGVNKERSGEIVRSYGQGTIELNMQGNSGEPNIECSDAGMQVVEQGNSEGSSPKKGSREDSESEDGAENNGVNSCGSEISSTISKDVENGGNEEKNDEQENMEGEYGGNKADEGGEGGEGEGDAGEMVALLGAPRSRGGKKGEESEEQGDGENDAEDKESEGDEESGAEGASLPRVPRKDGGKEDEEGEEEVAVPKASHKLRAPRKLAKKKPQTPGQAQEQKPVMRGGTKGRDHAKAGSSKEFPILLDDFFAIEKISLAHKTKVKKYDSDRPVFAYGPDGSRFPLTFALHSRRDIDRLHGFADAINQPVPLHVRDPGASIFRVMKEADFKQLSTAEILAILATNCIVVTDRMTQPIEFDAKGLSTLSTLSTIVPIQDQSRKLDKSGSYGVRVLQGTLQQLLDCSQMEGGKGGKILNALQFPMPEEGLGDNPFSTDSATWRGTKGWAACDEKALPPTADIRWGIAATTGALHWWHIDSDGFGTYIDVKTGLKWWIVAKPKKRIPLRGSSHYDFSEFASIDLFTQSTYELEDPCTLVWDLEAVLLSPGTRLIMRPNLPHAVYTPKHAICHGGHFYAISAIQDTMFGLVHSFIAGNLVTNTDHVSSRELLRRMVHFYHGAFVLGIVDKNHPAHDHIPDLREFKSLLDIVTLCSINIFINALDGRTYVPKGSESELEQFDYNIIPTAERMSCIYTRGKCVDLLDWIGHNYVLRDSVAKLREPSLPMMLAYILQQASAIRAYKVAAEGNSILGSDSALSCTAERLAKQLEVAVNLLPVEHSKKKNFAFSDAPTSLAWKGVQFEVLCDDKLEYREDRDFAYYRGLGTSQADVKYLRHLGIVDDDPVVSSDVENKRAKKRRRP